MVSVKQALRIVLLLQLRQLCVDLLAPMAFLEVRIFVCKPQTPCQKGPHNIVAGDRSEAFGK